MLHLCEKPEGAPTAMRHCPSCSSTRVRSGYRPAPFTLRIIGFRELLCDNCNYLYRAFSPLPPKHPKRSQSRPANGFAPAPPKNSMPAIIELPKAPSKPAPKAAPFPPNSHVCPHCGSSSTSRRRRTYLQRRIFFLSKKRPYICNNCDRGFSQKSGA